MSSTILELFCRNAEANAARVSRIQKLEEAIPLIRDFIQEHSLPATIRLSPQLAQDWPESSGLNVSSGTTEGQDLMCASRAWAAVADTGTLVLLSGQENPTRLNFLSDYHLVFVKAEQVKESKSEIWGCLETLPTMPRAVNFISGPSRTADIEQTIQLGAHGPRYLWIFLLQT